MYYRHCSIHLARPNSPVLALRSCQLDHHDWHHTCCCSFGDTWICAQRMGIGTRWPCLHRVWRSSVHLPHYRITSHPVAAGRLRHRFWASLPCPSLPMAIMGLIARSQGQLKPTCCERGHLGQTTRRARLLRQGNL